MRTTKYLYDSDVSEFADMKYRDAIRYKRDKAKALAERLDADIRCALESGAGWNSVFALRARLHSVKRAVMYNDELIDEIEQ